MVKKAIFFDNDGVLVDTEKYYFQATQTILSQVGLTLTEDDFINYFLKQSTGAWFLLEEKGFTKHQISELRNSRNNLYNQLLKSEPLEIPGVKRIVEQLSKRFLLAIVTSSRRDHFESIHESTDLLKYFDFVLTREDYRNAKPDPEPYLLAQAKSGFLKEECLIIEDSERGLIAAKSACIDCVVIPTELTKNSDFSGAKSRLNSMTELFDYIIKKQN